MEEQRAAKRQAELSRVALQNQKMRLLNIPKSAREKDSKENSDRERLTPMSNEEEILQQVSWSNLARPKDADKKKSEEPEKEEEVEGGGAASMSCGN